LILFTVLQGCANFAGLDDLRDAPPDTYADGGPPCIKPTAGMVVSADTTLCSGTFALSSRDAAIEVVTDGVTLACDGTVLDGERNGGDVENPTVGIRIGALSGVTVRGCTAKGYRYGLVAKGSKQLTLDSIHLDDNFTDPTEGWVSDLTLQQAGGGALID